MDVKFSCQTCGQNIVVDSSEGGSATQCPSCSAPLTIPEIIPPVLPVSPPQKKHNILSQLFLAVLVLFALGIIGIALYEIGASNESKNASRDEAGDAYYAAKKFCERYAPSATKFTTETGGDYLDGKAEWVNQLAMDYWIRANGLQKLLLQQICRTMKRESSSSKSLKPH